MFPNTQVFTLPVIPMKQPSTPETRWMKYYNPKNNEYWGIGQWKNQIQMNISDEDWMWIEGKQIYPTMIQKDKPL